MKCIVLAGGIPSSGDPLYADAGGKPKVLIDVNGRPILQRVLEAVHGSGRIDRIVVAGLPPHMSLPGGLQADLVADAGGPVANLFAGIDRIAELAPRDEPCLFCWGDLPLISADGVQRLLNRCLSAPHQITLGLVERARIEALRPGIATSYLRLRDGEFKSTDAGITTPEATYRVRRYLEALAPNRKNLLDLARIISPTLLLRYVSGRLDREELGHRISRKVGVDCGTVLVQEAAMCMDIDDEEDLAWCRAHLRSTAGARR